MLTYGGVVECISEPEPCRHQVDERMSVFALVNTLEEITIDHIGVNTLKRDDEM